MWDFHEYLSSYIISLIHVVIRGKRQKRELHIQTSRRSDPATFFKKMHNVFSMNLVEVWWIASFYLNALASQEVVLKGNESCFSLRFAIRGKNGKNPKTFRARKASWAVKLQSACFEKLIFEHAFNVRKTKRTAKFDGLAARRSEDIKGIVATEIGPKSFGTLVKQASGHVGEIQDIASNIPKQGFLSSVLYSL